MVNSGFIERRSIDYVPLAERHGKVWHLWPVWFSGDANLATLAVGVLGITLGGNLLWTAVAVVAGCAFGTFFMAFHSTQGPQLGLPQMIQSRPQFGYAGALLVWAVALVAYIGFNAFNQVLAVQALHQLWPAIAPTSALAMIVFAVAAASVAAIGYDTIHLAQRAIAYLMIAILSVFSVGACLLLRFPEAQWDAAGFRAVPFIAQLFAAASYQLSWSIYVSDYSRYLPRDVSVRSSFWWTYLGAFIGGTWMMLVGTVAAASNPGLDVAAAMQRAADLIVPGLGAVLLLGALLGLVTISALNFYGASLTLLSVADTFGAAERRGRQAHGQPAGGRGAGNRDCADARRATFVTRFGDLLALLLYLFTPWTAINLVDFYLVRQCALLDSRDLQCRWHVRTLELARAAGLWAGLRRDDPVLQHRHVHRADCARIGWRGCGDAGGPAGRGHRVLPRLPQHGCGSGPVAGRSGRCGACALNSTLPPP